MTGETALPGEVRGKLFDWQGIEITEHQIYSAIAGKEGESANRKVLEETAAVELAHYRFFRSLTGAEAAPDRFRVAFYLLVYRVLGITFSLKLMERGERRIQGIYRELVTVVPGLEVILRDEERHERELLALIDEDRLKYTGSMVLGLNDALVELTGTLAGFTFALQNAKFIAAAGLITGVAAALSMGAAEYLSTKSEGGDKNPVRAAMYTAVAYILTVFLLVAPYLLLSNYFLCLAITLVFALLVILVFTFYISVAKDLDFRARFLEMTAISLAVATLSFLVGFAVRIFLGVNL